MALSACHESSCHSWRHHGSPRFLTVSCQSMISRIDLTGNVDCLMSVHFFFEQINRTSEYRRLQVSSVGQSSHLPFANTATDLLLSWWSKKPSAASPSLRKIVVPAMMIGASFQSCRTLKACAPGTSNNLSPFNCTFGRLGYRLISTNPSPVSEKVNCRRFSLQYSVDSSKNWHFFADSGAPNIL